MDIAFLGLGAMGTRMALRLVRAGHQVHVWNRSCDSARALVAEGALLMQTPAQAASQADIIIAMLRDDEASRAVWTDGPQRALAGLHTGTVVIECSTLSPGWIATLAKHVADSGGRFAEAPVVGSRPQAEAGALIHLVGADDALAAQIDSVLAITGATRLHAGPVGHGTAAKLIINALFGVQVAALAEALRMAQALGLEKADAAQLLAETPVASPAMKAAAGLMLAGKDEPMFPIDLVAKDFGYAAAVTQPLPLITAAAELYARAAKGPLASRHITAIRHLDES